MNLYGFVGNDGVNSWDYLGLTEPGVLYDSIEDATHAGGIYAHEGAMSNLRSEQEAHDALTDRQKVTRTRRSIPFEYCGRICCNKSGQFYFTTYYTGRSTERCPPELSGKCDEGHEEVGFYHNHPDTNTGDRYRLLSPADRNKARQMGSGGATYTNADGELETRFYNPSTMGPFESTTHTGVPTPTPIPMPLP